MVRQKLNNQGFTFVELVVAVAILGVITASIASFMATTSRVHTKTSNDSEVQSQAQEVYDQLSNCIMQANKVILYGSEISEDASSGAVSYGTPKYYISDNQSGATGYDNATGYLVDEDNNFLDIGIKTVDSTSVSSVLGSKCAFVYLEKDVTTAGVTTKEMTEVRVEALYVEYQTKIGSTYENCYATFVVGSDGDLYLNRHYDSDSDIDTGGYRITDTDTAIAVLDLTESETSKLCKTLVDDGLRVMVDAENNSIGLVLNFDNYSMTYETLGMVKIRNKAVLAR